MVTLINAFELAQTDKTDEFVRLWKESAALMISAPGFIDTKLHRSVDAKSKFQFVNIAHWESPAAWQQAIAASPALQDWWKKIAVIAHANPALYRVDTEYSAATPARA